MAGCICNLSLCIGLYFRPSLFPSVLRNSLTTPHSPPIPTYTQTQAHTTISTFPPTTLCPPIYLASLQRPYTQHASQSHLEFFTCSLCFLSTLFPSPSSLRQYKQWKDQKVRRGAKSLYRVSIWPRFRSALHTHKHMLKADTQVNMQTLYSRTLNKSFQHNQEALFYIFSP